MNLVGSRTLIDEDWRLVGNKSGVWEGIRRTHTTRPAQTTPLMPPQLWDVLDACPTTKPGKTTGGPTSRAWPATGTAP